MRVKASDRWQDFHLGVGMVQMQLSQLKLEAYLYHLEAVLDQSDADPLKALLFHWPAHTPDADLVQVVGQLAAIVQFCLSVQNQDHRRLSGSSTSSDREFGPDDNDDGEKEDGWPKGCCQSEPGSSEERPQGDAAADEADLDDAGNLSRAHYWQQGWPNQPTIQLTSGHCEFALLPNGYVFFLMTSVAANEGQSATLEPPEDLTMKVIERMVSSLRDFEYSVEKPLQLVHGLNLLDGPEQLLTHLLSDCLSSFLLLYGHFSAFQSKAAAARAFMAKYFGLVTASALSWPSFSQTDLQVLSPHAPQPDLCEDLMLTCQHQLPNVLVAGGVFLSSACSSWASCSQNIYFFNKTHLPSKVMRCLQLADFAPDWSQDSKAGWMPFGVRLIPLHREDRAWSLFANVLNSSKSNASSGSTDRQKPRLRDHHGRTSGHVCLACSEADEYDVDELKESHRNRRVKSQAVHEAHHCTIKMVSGKLRDILHYDQCQGQGQGQTSSNSATETDGTGRNYSLFVHSLGSLYMALILATSVQDMDQASVHNLWSIGMAKLPYIHKQVMKSRL